MPTVRQSLDEERSLQVGLLGPNLCLTTWSSPDPQKSFIMS